MSNAGSQPWTSERPAGGLAPTGKGVASGRVGGGWRLLFGDFREVGFRFAWHDFHCAGPLEWAHCFAHGGVELCLNLAGRGVVSDGQQRTELTPRTLAFYRQGRPSLAATREGGGRHQFIAVEFAPEFLARHFGERASSLHPLVGGVVRGNGQGSAVGAPERLNTALLSVVESLRRPPVFLPAQAVWFQSKALELAAQLFFVPPDGEMFCTRAQRAGRERVERARTILRERLREAPSLEELGRLVGCSPFYLSRLFSQETGTTIQQYLRQVRLERAAELLRTGRCNVTEAALEVGYSSVSHFSTAFREMFNCCPGLYPLRTPAQQLPAAEGGDPLRTPLPKLDPSG